MIGKKLSVKKMFFWLTAGMTLTMTAIILVAFFLTQNIVVLWVGMALIVCAILWMLFMVQLLGMRLSNFTSELCQILDDMMNRSQEPENVSDKETIFARIHHRLVRLYNILQESNRKVEAERQELQSLVSDISHQVRTPVSNMKMIVDTLLTKPLEEQERNEFLKSVRGQINKLDFLIQALVKTSRLETGVIQLEKEEHFLYDTLAQAMSGILYSAEQKKIHVSVECPEDLCVSHDSKWTEEAIFNLLDNAVKYTPTGGHVNVSVAQWEMYVEIKVSDTGKGISESNQASIFKRFYREEEIHNQPGVGIGLYLTREIVTQQGGYVTVESQVGKALHFLFFCRDKGKKYMEDKMTAVKLISLTKEYLNGENYIRAVDDVSFSIKEGEFIAVIGASGSGKSTLINLISGLEKPTHGCVYVHDVNLTQLSLEEQISFRRWHIGVIFQKYNLIPAMNVFENIVLPAKLLEKKVDEKEVFRLAKMLGIEDKLFQVPDELSGGQQQRAAIARAVYTHPTILLGDELTGNLDSGTSISVMRLLKEICRQYKQTLLIVTHDENVAAMADRIICMKDGKVVKDENI